MGSITSVAAQVIISIIPIVGIFMGGAILLLTILWHHTEEKMKIQSGNYKRPRFNYKAYVLLIGLLLISVGFALTLFFLLVKGISNSLLGGLIPLAIGIGLVTFYKINDWNSRSSDE